MNEQPPIEMFVGLVTAVATGPTGFGAASLYSYDVFVNFPVDQRSGSGPRICPGLKPAMQRWDDSINVIPLEINSVVHVASIAGELQLLARELPHTVPCGGQASAKSMETLASVLAMTREQKAMLRQALGVA